MMEIYTGYLDYYGNPIDSGNTVVVFSLYNSQNDLGKYRVQFDNEVDDYRLVSIDNYFSGPLLKDALEDFNIIVEEVS